MLLEEWNLEDAKKVWREEAHEEVLELLDQGLSAEEIRKQLYSELNTSSKLYNRE